MSLHHTPPKENTIPPDRPGNAALGRFPLTLKPVSWSRLWLDQTHPWALAEPGQRPALRAFWFDGLFVAMGAACINTFLPLYALGMGASASQIGLLSSAQGATGVVGSVFGSRFALWLRSNKKAAWWGNRVIAPAMLLVFVLLPWLVPGHLIVYALIAAAATRSFFSYTGSPGWAALAAAIIPEHLRGRYFSSRTMIQLISMVAVVPLAGLLIARAGGYPSGFQLNFAVAVLLFSGATYWYWRIPEPADSRPTPSARQAARPWWQAQNFVRFAVATFLWSLGAGIAGPFYAVYMTRSLGLNAETIGLLTAVATFFQFSGLFFFGTLNDRKGSRWLTGVMALIAAPLPWAWLLTHSAWHIVPIQALGGLTLAGFNLGVFNLMLLCAPHEDLTRYTSVYYMVMAGGGIVAPLLGGVLFESFGLAGTVIIGGLVTLAAALTYLFLVKETSSATL
ncbi:MAG: MFS transporter [Anaerolineae bacterium]|nr:MFS transporter [Anaerolineae bacterium]